MGEILSVTLIPGRNSTAFEGGLLEMFQIPLSTNAVSTILELDRVFFPKLLFFPLISNTVFKA